MNLLHRFYDPTSGRLTIDSHDVRTFVPARQPVPAIALVPRDTILFGGPIRDNIRYGRGMPPREIIAASTAAMPMEFIGGFLTAIRRSSAKGHQLVRRPAATRRIAERFSKPQILLPTRPPRRWIPIGRLVQEALERLMVNRTTFVVAHRLSTIQR